MGAYSVVGAYLSSSGSEVGAYSGGGCSTASGNILACGNFFKELLMVPLETIELLIF